MAKKPSNETPAAAPEILTVKALANLAENGAIHKPGDIFETTPERAAALGALVEILES